MAKFIKITTTGGIPKTFRRDVHKRARAAATAAGRAIAKGIQEDVQERIPKGEKWLDLYRDAIKFLENDKKDEWAIAGLSRTKLTTVPAESTQIKIGGSNPIAIEMAKHNPWTVDTLPPISGGIPAEAEVRPASPAEMDGHRRRLREVYADLVSKITKLGATVTDGVKPSINGKVFIDLVFLQMRLEHGLGGFPRVPHWLKTARAAKNQAPRWVAAAGREIREALAGGRLDEVDKLTEDLRKRLEKRRDESWL